MDEPPPGHSIPEQRDQLENDVCIHIFTASASMLGVCITVIGLLHVVTVIRKVDSIADDLLVVNSIMFLVSCLSSYFALRTRSRRRMHRLERFADAVFIVAMSLMVVVCGVITYAIAGI